MTSPTELIVLFAPVEPPLCSRIVLTHPQAQALPQLGDPEAIRLFTGSEIATKPARMLTISEALPFLLNESHQQPTAIFWRHAAREALRLIAQGQVQNHLSPKGFDSWRIAPLDTQDARCLEQLASAMPPQARAAVPENSTELADPRALLRDFYNAIADTLTRVGNTSEPFIRTSPAKMPELADWAREQSQTVDLSLRVDMRDEAFAITAQIHSRADVSRIVDAERLWEAKPPTGFTQHARTAAVSAISRAAGHWPLLSHMLDTPVPSSLDLKDTELVDLLGPTGDALRQTGITVHWPRELVHELTTRARISRTDSRSTHARDFFAPGQLLDFRWQIALEGTPMTSAELRELADAHRPLVRLRDRWVLVSPDVSRKARKPELKPLTAIDALSAALTGTVEIGGKQVAAETDSWLAELRTRLTSGSSIKVAAPATLRATLREYQLDGLRWLVNMTELGLGACLADDMGLGKTITLIALHLHRQESEPAPTLVVCPASLMGNWQREIERFAPGTSVYRYHGGKRALPKTYNGFVLTTYGTMRLDAEKLGGGHWGLLIADEAQHVKNARSGTAKALRKIPARAKVALTGTPVENNLSELWSILDWTTPGLLGTLGGFRRRWAGPIESDRDAVVAARFAELIRPFLLRRRKSDPGIAPELPAKTETDQLVGLTVEQAGLYQAVVEETLAQLSHAKGMERRGLIIKLLTSLKQICNHPAQYLREDARRSLAGRSGKFDLLDELLETIVAERGATLIFTQYVAMARLLERHLNSKNIKHQLLHGGTPIVERERQVQQFQEGGMPVFLLSLKAAGTGLNLTRADHVIHFDRWWNPAVEDQATDRAYRIGQTNPVQVHRLVTEGTIEDRIASMLAEKRGLADSVLRNGESAFTELSDTELANLVELRSAR